ncbi:MAG: prolipoprotein diacylglyceryl transferase [Deltaproteobacteria bacterium]|nr:prolipoprotein diacylglyceryl transferase [Deltaproteobacteria bacterium]
MSYPQIDPEIFSIGPLSVRWYGMMYLLAFVLGFGIVRYLGKLRHLAISKETVSDLFFYVMLGVILGGRLGYVLFYNFDFYLHHPLSIPAVWEGGMSFHGGLLGVIIASYLFCRKKDLPVLLVGDILVAAASLGLGFGRLGNFINAELWGRTTDMPWGMVFPGAGPLPRHPSQLYEAVLEGAVLFSLLMWMHHKKATYGIPFFSFFFFYGCFRFFVEFFREPDAQLGFLWSFVTMGQLLSVPMILFAIGGWLFVFKKRQNE